MSIELTAACTGSDVAKAAWKLTDDSLAVLIHKPEPNDFEDVRSQFALWATANPARQFPGGVLEAWDAFTAPKMNKPHPVVILPGSPCRKCSATRFIAGSVAPTGYHTCSACFGTRRKPPRAIAAYPSERLLAEMRTSSEVNAS